MRVGRVEAAALVLALSISFVTAAHAAPEPSVDSAPSPAVQRSPSPAPEAPLTVAESTGFRRTSTHADVMRFIAELQRSSDLVRVETMATTVEGKPVPLIVIGDPVPSSPAELARDDRAVVYFQANIHAGEVEGKEAAQMLARDIVRGVTPNYLDKLVILIAPDFNPDGNDKISTEHRVRQHGPEGGVGIRYNGQNLDLNRDAVKLETPEVRGLVRNVLQRWDPIFVLDSHTHNGSYHQEPVTWVWGLNPNGDGAIISYMEDVLLPSITEIMQKDYGTMSIPHGDFVDPRDPERGWEAQGTDVRYIVNYVGLRDRFSILNEQYPYVDFGTRIHGAYSLFRAFLDHIYRNKDEMVRLVADADRKAVASGANPGPGDAFIVEYEREALDKKLTIRGWEMEIQEREGTWPHVRPTDRERVYRNVPYFAHFVAKRTVPYAYGYLMPVYDAAVVENLTAHGIVVERLAEPATLEVESFTVTEVSGAERPNQGHYTSSAKGDYSTVEMEFAAGTVFVRTAQPLGRLASFLLEPESGDGLLFWDFFDRYLVPQWGRSPQTYPVYRVLSKVDLATAASQP
jgi:murein tripeptide amidase MpaA